MLNDDRRQASDYPYGSVIGVKFVDKLIYGVSDTRYHPRQYINDGNEFSKTTLLENYLCGNIGVCLKLRCIFSKSNAEYFYAVFSNLCGVWDIEGHDFNLIAADGFHRFSGRSDIDGLTGGGDSSEDDKEPMFIYVAQFANRSQDCVPGRFSAARLYRSDQFLSRDANVLYQSLFTGLSEFFSRGVNGEMVPFLNRVAVPNDQSTEKMLKAGMEVVGDFARENRKSVWNRERLFCYKRILGSIVLKFSNKGIGFGVRIQEGVELDVDILDAFVGPLNFRSTPAQQTRHDTT